MGARPFHRRSIPAHAGKPITGLRCARALWVYPRPRGEALEIPHEVLMQEGLSPPTRGSRRLLVERQRRQGSIPAHAGKPYLRNLLDHIAEVYPRPRGEADGDEHYIGYPPGLSPPTRGSHVEGDGVKESTGSIPAHAGKPHGGPVAEGSAGVYPRPRGEAMRVSKETLIEQGLSPPTRGSPPSGWSHAHTRRSIPAHAGKPHYPRRSYRHDRVYPRPRGEAKHYE